MNDEWGAAFCVIRMLAERPGNQHRQNLSDAGTPGGVPVCAAGWGDCIAGKIKVDFI